MSFIKVNGKKYSTEYQTRLTDCCGAFSTYDDHGSLYCKKCFCEVDHGQGDGSEEMPTPLKEHFQKRNTVLSKDKPKRLREMWAKAFDNELRVLLEKAS